MKSSIMAMGLSASLFITSMGSTSAEVHYKDVKENDNYYSAVGNLLDQNAISSNLDMFRPNEYVTRGQASSIIARVLKLDTENIRDPKFKDVPKDSQFYKYIAVLENEGIVGGREDGTFGVNEPLKRGQMASILVKAFDIPLIGGHDIGLNAFYEHSSYMGVGDGEDDDFMGDVWLILRGQFAQEIETLNYYGYVSGYKTRYSHWSGEAIYEFKKGEYVKRSQLALMIEKIQKGTQYEYLYFEDFNITNRSVSKFEYQGWRHDKAEIDDPSIISLEEISNYETNVWLEGLHSEQTINNVYAILKPKKSGKTFARFDDGGTGKEKVIEITVTKSNEKFEVSYKDVTPEK